MSAEVEYAQLQATDTVVAVRERLSGMRGKRVLLIWPAASSNLRRKLDLILIQREAYRRAIQLAIVAQDADLHFHAAELNISCFASIAASECEPWKRGRHKVFLPRFHKPSVDLLAEDLAFMRTRHTKRSTWWTILERFFALVLVCLAVGASFFTLVPGAVVTLSLKIDDIDVVFDIVADRKVKAVDATKGIIPAETIRATVESAATIPTSGSIRLNSVSAAAAVTFTNLGDGRVDIPRGLILGTSAGEPILFQTMADVVVPAGAGRQVDAVVEAMESYRGSIGNVGPGMINTVLGGLDERVSVINLTSAAGGGNRNLKTVARADHDRLLEILRIQLQSLAYEQFRAGLSDSQIIIIESIKIEEERKEWTDFSADVGAMTSELSLSMRAVVSTLAIDDRFGRQLLLARLKAAAPAEKELLLETVSYTRGPFSQSKADGQISFTVRGSAAVKAQLDSNRLREQLAGKSIDEARQLLAASAEISSADPPQFLFFPSSLQQMPPLAVRIVIEVEDE